MKQKPFAIWENITKINTDPQRFQNRVDAFSELSAEAVANNFDVNKFDPIVVWLDPNDQKIYVLSGHSRLEGMRRRNAQEIPIRFFEGSEAEAIKFARIDANRSANKENLIEDLKAYRLSRDGDAARKIAPLTKKELAQAFKGKDGLLEALSYLNPSGKYIQVLADEDSISQFPRIQSTASWVGNLRRLYPNMTNTHEEDTFNYLYGGDDNYKVKRDDFEKLVKERLSWNKSRIFPECMPGAPCEEIKDLKEVGQNREMYRELNRLSNELEELKKRFTARNAVTRIYTEPEKQALKQVGLKIEKELKTLQKDLGKLEESPVLFGTPKTYTYEIIYYLGNKKQKHLSTAAKVSEAKREIKRGTISKITKI